MANTPNTNVAIICATYNHAPYIADALKSFMEQQTTFNFKVYVGDDASTDETPKIISRFAKEYPDLIVPVLRSRNIGAGRNWEDLISLTNATYLAFCDGDDYWCSPLKLQRQFDYMESHPRQRACFHDVLIKIETNDGHWFQEKNFSHTEDGLCHWPKGNKRFKKKREYSLLNYIPFGFVHTSSMFIRWDYSISFPDWYFGHGVGDYPLWVLQINTGKFGYLDDTMSVHRRTDSGSYSFVDRLHFWHDSKRGWIPLIEGMISYLEQYPDSAATIRALKQREREELAKYIYSVYAIDGPDKAQDVILSFSNQIAKLCKTTVPPKMNRVAFEKYYKQLQRRMPLPPYNGSVEAILRHKKDRLFEKIRLSK